MHSCSNCSNCKFITDRWEQGQVIGSYSSCKLDNSVITNEEYLSNCEHWKLKKVISFDFTVRPQKLECPF